MTRPRDRVCPQEFLSDGMATHGGIARKKFNNRVS